MKRQLVEALPNVSCENVAHQREAACPPRWPEKQFWPQSSRRLGVVAGVLIAECLNEVHGDAQGGFGREA
jgi:hypothetical protein